MTAAEIFPLISVDQYLDAEQASSARHEYLGGYVYAMAGARTVHNRIATNFLGALHAQLRGKTCEPFNSDMKLRIRLATHTRFYYPDAMVVCDANPPEDPYQDQPVVVAEVISEETRRVDEGEKREAYLSIPSLRVYLLIESDRARVTAYRRGEQGFAIEQYEGLEAKVPLDEVAASLALRELYDRVAFPPPLAS